MRFEKTKNEYPSGVVSNSLERTSNLNSPLRLPIYKLIILLLSITCFSAFKHNEPLSINQANDTLEKIASIKNPYKRGVDWFIHVYKISLSQPQIVHQQLAIGKELWATDFIDKQAILLLTAAEIAKVHSDFENTTSNVLKAIQLLEINNNSTHAKKKLLSLAYIAFARFSKYTKDKEGLDYAYKGLALANSINFATGKAFAHNQIGLLIGYSRNDYHIALDHFMQAKELLPQLPSEVSDFFSGFIIGNIAKSWSDLGDIEKSIAYKLKVLEGKHQNLELLLGTNNNLGSNYYTLKQYDLAEKYLQNTLDLMEEYNVYTNQGIPLLRMGLIQLEKGDIIEASTYADAIDYWLINHKFLGNYKVDFYQFKCKIAKAANDFEQAIFWIEKASTEQDSLTKIVGFNNLVKLEESNKLREIQQEQLFLEKELAANKAIVSYQNMILLAISSITILSIMFGISFYEKTKELREAYNFILNKNNVVKAIKSAETSKGIDKVLKQKILHSLEVEKSFLSPNLTLKKFADQLSSNTSYVSQTINEGCGKNFNTLINEYRIKEILLFFEEGQHQTFTIESLYKKAGFKSKSSFQKAFKSKMGVTASHYLEHLSKFPPKN